MLKQYLKRKRAKDNLMKCFRQGGIFLKYHRNERDYRLFPKIVNVGFEEEYIVYHFKLLTGINPDVMHKNHFVFRQVFGENVDIEKEPDDKSVTLKVYKKGLPSFVTFDFHSLNETMKNYDIPIVMGVDQGNQMNVFDLKKFHHVQITGVTNTGKSVYLKTILTSLCLYFPPNELNLYLGDMKRTELTLFKNLLHTKKTVTNIRDLETMLLELMQEVDKRYELMEQYEVSHMDDVNKIIEKSLPYVICMIDEFGLCAESKEVLKLVQDLTSIARAANVYLFLSLQRADSTVISGIAKNNLGVKISFKQSSNINARVAGVEGVEELKLSDKGRAIMDVGSSIKKIQTPFITTEQVKSLIKPYIQSRPTIPEIQEEVNDPLQADEIFGVVSTDE